MSTADYGFSAVGPYSSTEGCVRCNYYDDHGDDPACFLTFMLGVKEHNRYQHRNVIPAFVRAEHDCDMYWPDPELLLSIILPVTIWTTRKLSEQKLRQLPGRRTASHLMFSRLVLRY